MEKLKSRKFWMAVAGILTSLFIGLTNKDVDPEITASIGAGLFALYIVVEGIIDAVRAGKK